MEYLFSLLLFALNLFNYEYSIPEILFFIAGTILFCVLFYFAYIKTKNFISSCLIVMCHTWPISWINIFGRPSEELQITWFYVVGVLVLGYFFSNLKKLKNNNVSAVMLSVFAFIAVLSIYPIMLSPSKGSAMKEFIMIAFFIIMVFVATLMSDTLSSENKKRIIDAYIFCVSVCSVLLIFQYVYHTATGDTIFKYAIGNYMGKPMVSSNLLMEDTSSATIMLATGVFYMLERVNKKEKTVLNILLIIITVAGLAFTTRRTSIVSLAICIVLYVLIVYKDFKKKLIMMIFAAGIVFIMITYLALTRSIEDMSMLLYSNGRLLNFTESIELFIKHPLGIGYDNDNLVSYFSEVIPHNTFLRWLNMCGILFACAMLFLLVYIMKIAAKKRLTDDFWALFCSFVAMNFIPDILNARFFVIPCMLALLSKANDAVDIGTSTTNRLKYTGITQKKYERNSFK